MNAKTTLTGLHDIRGVQGSFVLRRPGSDVVARDGLSLLSGEGLAETGRRLEHMFQTIGTVCHGADEVFLRFEGMTLFVRGNDALLLGVLGGDSVSLPALRMASTLVMRALEAVDLGPPPATDSVPEAAPSTGTPLRYRGAPVTPR
jgi:hypothetical protein